MEKKRNTSLLIPDVAARVAELKKIDIREVGKVKTENVKQLLKIEWRGYR